MPISPTRAMQKWERNTSQAASRWKNGVQRAQNQNAFCEGVANFLDDPGLASACQNDEGQAWADSVGAVSASDFQNSVEGRGQAWLEGLRNRFGS
mgnify:CR=1 FL=1